MLQSDLLTYNPEADACYKLYNAGLSVFPTYIILRLTRKIMTLRLMLVTSYITLRLTLVTSYITLRLMLVTKLLTYL